MQHGLDGRLVVSGKTSVIEMPPDVGVRVDEAGRYGEARQVVHDRVTRDGAANAGDLFAFDYENGVVQDVAFTIENGRGLQHNGTLLRGGELRSKGEQAGEDAQNSEHGELLYRRHIRITGTVRMADTCGESK